jgi:hypothetical protein
MTRFLLFIVYLLSDINISVIIFFTIDSEPLAANNQKANFVFKAAAKLNAQMRQVLRHYQISSELVPADGTETMKSVLGVIRDGDRDL